MPPAQVAALDRLPGAAPLQFVQPMYYSNQIMYLTLQVTPNITYAIQASTNLQDWVTITNVTSPNPLVRISDPQAASYPHRFYRGVAQLGTLTAPAVTTLAASSLQLSNATLNASITPNGALASFYFQYGTNTSYGGFTPTNTLPAGSSPVLTNCALAGLLPNTTYHFQAVALNSAGAATGGDLTFTTLARPAITSTVLQPGPKLALTLSGTPGISYTLESSTNLLNWSTRSNCVMAGNGLFQFVEVNTTNPPVRFYRLRWP
jgi:hypothetical protein